MLLKNIMLVAKPARLLKNLKKVSTLLDCTQFGLFLMCFNTAYKLVLCVMRRLGCLEDKINAPVAGFMSALTLAIDTSNRRALLTVLTMSRAIECGILMGESKGVIPTLKHRDMILWLLANMFLQSAMGLKQGILNKGIAKFFKTWSQMTPNDETMVATWHRMLADGVKGF